MWAALFYGLCTPIRGASSFGMTMDLIEPKPVVECSAVVLIVDDDSLACTAMSRHLRELHCARVHTVRTGFEALAMLRGLGARVSLIFLNLNLPGMDGLELLRRLGTTGFDGQVVLLSEADEVTLRSVRMLAAEHRLPIVGVYSKPMRRSDMVHALGRRPGEAARRPLDAPTHSPSEIAMAIAQGEIGVHYQPQVRTDHGALVGVEALARWFLRDGRIAAPAEFIPVAETNGLIHELTTAVARAAIEQSARWSRFGLRLNVSINVTMDDLRDDGVARALIAMAHEHGVPPRSIVIEVTESQMMGVDDTATIRESLIRLRLHGFRLSIDDFGTGHSTFEHLRDLPFDELKLDRSFARRSHEDPRLAAFVRSTLLLARELRVESVAEGIESVEDWNYLRRAGTERAQGFFVARPMPAVDVAGWAMAWGERVRDGALCPSLNGASDER